MRGGHRPGDLCEQGNDGKYPRCNELGNGEGGINRDAEMKMLKEDIRAGQCRQGLTAYNKIFEELTEVGGLLMTILMIVFLQKSRGVTLDLFSSKIQKYERKEIFFLRVGWGVLFHTTN